MRGYAGIDAKPIGLSWAVRIWKWSQVRKCYIIFWYHVHHLGYMKDISPKQGTRVPHHKPWLFNLDYPGLNHHQHLKPKDNELNTVEAIKHTINHDTVHQYGPMNFMNLNHWAPWNCYLTILLPAHSSKLSCSELLQLEFQAENAASDAAFARRPLEVALETAVEDSGCGVMLRLLRAYLVVYYQRVYIDIDISSTYILQDLGIFHGIFRMGLVVFHFPLLQKGV